MTMSTITPHKNHIRSPSNSGKEDEQTASFYNMAMAIAMDLSMGADCLMDDWSPTENANKDLSIHPPPLLERQRSSSPRSVSGFWPMGFFVKDSSNMVGAGSIDANDNNPTDCLDAPPPPLITSISSDLMNLMHEYFTNDIVREILPKTTLTFYADREHKVDDFGIEEIDEEMKDAEAKMDSDLGNRKVLEEFPLQSSNGEADDSLSFLFGDNPPAQAKSTTLPMEKHSPTSVPTVGHEEKMTTVTKPSIKKKAAAKKKKATKVTTKKVTTAKVVSTGKNIASIKKKLTVKAAAMKKKGTKVTTKKVVTTGKNIASIKEKLTVKAAAKKEKATKVPAKKVVTLKVVSRGKTIASVKAKLNTANKATKKSTTKKSISKREAMPLVKKKQTENTSNEIADKKTTTSDPKTTSQKTPLKQQIEVDMCYPRKPDGTAIKNCRWEDHYKILKAFYDKNGHSNVLRSDPNQTLAGWVKRQRNNLRLEKLSPTHIQLLDDLGFIWNRIEQRWFEKFILLKMHAQEHGTIGAIKRDKQLAEWTQRQRRLYHTQHKSMTIARIEKLESIPGWSWQGVAQGTDSVSSDTSVYTAI